MTNDQARQFAEHWINAWNDHDPESVLSHYADDFEMTTPMIQRLLDIDTGTLRGKKLSEITGNRLSGKYLI